MIWITGRCRGAKCFGFGRRAAFDAVPRVALAIMMFTGASRSDAVLLGPPMVEEGSENARGVSRPQPSLYLTASKSKSWWAGQDSNLQPDRYERPALTIELPARPGAPREG